MQLKQNKASSNSIRKDIPRINSLEKQFHQNINQQNLKCQQEINNQQIPNTQQFAKTSQHFSVQKAIHEAKDKTQNSAIMQLLLIKDQQHQWKQKYHANVRNKSKKQTKNKNLYSQINKTFFRTGFHPPHEIQQSKQFGNNLLNKNSIENIFPKHVNNRNSNYKKSQEIKNQHQTSQSQLFLRNRISLLNNNKANTFFMNRTNYWSKLKKSQRVSELSLMDKFSNSQQKQPQNLSINYNANHNQKRVNSHFGFYRKNLGQMWQNQQINIQKSEGIYEPYQQNQGSSSIKILSNKAFTVRQMLHKIQSRQNINLAENSKQLNQKEKSKSSQLFTRHPFDPYTKKSSRQHYKKFTAYKMQEQKRIEYSLIKLQEHLKYNPEIKDQWGQLQVKYLEKPTYCSWVERNKLKIKRGAQSKSLTVKPLLRMVN